MDALLIQLMAAKAVPAAFNIGTLLENAKAKVIDWGGAAVMLIGAVMIIVAGYQIARGLMTQGKPGGSQTNWLVVILLLVVGGAFLIGGYTMLSDVAQVGKDTIEELATEGGGGGGSASVPSQILWTLGL